MLQLYLRRNINRTVMLNALTVTLGLAAGMCLAILLVLPETISVDTTATLDYNSSSVDYDYEMPITNATMDQSPAYNRTILDDWHSNQTVADHLRKEIRVLCWIMTGPENHLTKAQHVLHTWGKHCNTLLFMTSVEDPMLPNSIPLWVDEGRENLWPKTHEAFKYIYEHHLDDADWFMKADDDTYAVMENLRLLVHPYSPATPIYFGHKFLFPTDQTVYMSGGAGYVLSKEAVKRFVEVAMTSPDLCNLDYRGPEDLEMGHCMKNIDVLAGDARDAKGLHRFYPLQLEYTLLPREEKISWYYKYSFYYPIEGQLGVPESAVSFHYTTPKWMYMMDYLLYGVHACGLSQIFEPIDEKKITADEVKRLLDNSKPSNLTGPLDYS